MTDRYHTFDSIELFLEHFQGLDWEDLKCEMTDRYRTFDSIELFLEHFQGLDWRI